MTTKMNTLGPLMHKAGGLLAWGLDEVLRRAAPLVGFGGAGTFWHAQDSAWLDAWTIEDGTRYVRLGLLELIFDPKTPRPVSA